MRAPVEFGFSTASYIPPEHPRPLWKTLLFGALIYLIPVVGPGMSAVYVDRRRIPSSFGAPEALRTALLQLLAAALLVAVVWLIVVVILGFSIQFNPRVDRVGS
jgi:hypothetical protein